MKSKIIFNCQKEQIPIILLSMILPFIFLISAYIDSQGINRIVNGLEE